MRRPSSRASKTRPWVPCLLVLLLCSAHAGLAGAVQESSGPDTSKVADLLLAGAKGPATHESPQSTLGLLQATAGALLRSPGAPPSQPAASSGSSTHDAAPSTAGQVASILRTEPAPPAVSADRLGAAVKTVLATVSSAKDSASRPTFQLRGNQDNSVPEPLAAAVGARLLQPEGADGGVSAAATASAAVLERAVQHVLEGDGALQEQAKTPVIAESQQAASKPHTPPSAPSLSAASEPVHSSKSHANKQHAPMTESKQAPQSPPTIHAALPTAPSRWGVSRQTMHEARAALFDLEERMINRVRELGLAGDPYGLDSSGGLGAPRTVLGLPKVIWAVVADLMAMLCFLMCIPIVLSCTKSRRRPGLGGGM